MNTENNQNLFNKITDSINTLLNLIYPPVCRVCETQLDSYDKICICDACWKTFEQPLEPICPKCGSELERPVQENKPCPNCPTPIYYNAAKAAFRHNGAVRKIIHEYKYNSIKEMSFPLGNFMAKHLHKHFDVYPSTIIAPVPLHWTRKLQRGFNQSYLLSAIIGNLLNIPVEKYSLVRRKITKTQQGLSRRERQHNLLGAFGVINPAAFLNKNIILIDDVMTTTSTVNECAKMLKESGAAQVFAYCLARAVQSDITNA